MTFKVRTLNTRPSLLALALLAAFPLAQAQTAPAVEGSATAGIGAIAGDREDRSLFNQYNGLRPGSNVFGLFSADYYRRDDERGTTTSFQASDLFNGNRDLGFRWKKQGDWKFSADYREGVRWDPNVVNSGSAGLGSTTPTVVALPGGPGTGSDYDLKLKRTSLGFGVGQGAGVANGSSMPACRPSTRKARACSASASTAPRPTRRAAAPPRAPKSAGRRSCCPNRWMRSTRRPKRA